MLSVPDSAAIVLNFAAIESSASSHEIRSNASASRPFVSGPFAAPAFRRIGYSSRSGEYTRSRYRATFPHRKPLVTGCPGSPCTLVARPVSVSTVTSTPQESGQSCVQTAWTIFVPGAAEGMSILYAPARTLSSDWSFPMRLTRLFALSLFALLLTLPAAAQKPATADEASIRAVLSKQAADWNRGDLDAFAAGYNNSPGILFIGSTAVSYTHLTLPTIYSV